MKRICTVLLAIMLTVSVLMVSTLLPVCATITVVGDANGDGQVNNRDLGYLQQVLNDWGAAAVGDADVNGDSRINNMDLGLLQLMLNGDKQTRATSVLSNYVSLGAPAKDIYSSIRYVARCPWDMTIHNGRLYVGCGDFNLNTGSSPVLSAPLSDPDNWSVEAWLPDEQIGRFYDYNGVLTIPGFDPLDKPEYGTYYQLINGEWTTVSTLPHGLHNFDLAWFEGQLFAAIGAYGGSSPVVVTDDGVNYRDIPMYKNGELVETDDGSVVRSMNIYVLGDTLYADLWYQSSLLQRSAFEMYRYNAEEDILEFVVDMKQVTHGGKYSAAGLPLWEKEALGDKMFVTTGYLYYTTNMQTYTQLTLPNSATAYDMVAFDGRMYILSAYQSGDKYQINVHSVTAASPTRLRSEVSFTYDQMPTAMTMDEDNFFIGIGNWHGNGSANNGTILQVKR